MGHWIDCAVLAHPKGLEGGLVCRAAAGLPFLLREGMACALVPPQLDAPRFVTVRSAGEPSRSGEALVRFAEVGDVALAERVAGCHCLVRADDLDAEALGGLVAAEGLGCGGDAVVDAEAGPIGVVEAIEEGPAQRRLVVGRPAGAPVGVPRGGEQGEGPEGAPVLVPLVDELVLAVDDAARTVAVALPAGLLDL